MGGSTTKPDDVCRLDPFNAHLQNLEAQREQKKRDQYEQAVALSAAQYKASTEAGRWTGMGKADWTNKALAAVGIDPANWAPYKGFEANRLNGVKVYAAYTAWYLGHPELKWAGMAKLAGGSVYAGMQRLVDEKPSLFSWKSAVPIWADVRQAERETLTNIETTFVGMQKDIFMDLGWQHQAYVEGGLGAIKAAYDRGDMSSANYEAWLKIGSGNTELNWEGNRTLLMREQTEILPPGYHEIQRNVGSDLISSEISNHTQSPIPGGASFREVYRAGDVTNVQDRWTWIDEHMLPEYKALGDEYTKALVSQPVTDLAERKFAPDPRPR